MECNTVRISGTIQESITDGTGIRYVLFTQGCPHHCTGCHNPQTHDFDAGEDRGIVSIAEEILSNPLLDGVTLSGGEPFCQAKQLVEFVEHVKTKNKKLDFWCYTGYTYSELEWLGEENEDITKLLKLVDVLVDGKFEQNRKDLALPFRGSHNQRILHLRDGVIVAEGIQE